MSVAKYYYGICKGQKNKYLSCVKMLWHYSCHIPDTATLNFNKQAGHFKVNTNLKPHTMKTKTFFIAALILGNTLFGYSETGINPEESKATMTIYSTSQSSELLDTWVGSFNNNQNKLVVETANYDETVKSADQLVVALENDLNGTSLETMHKMVIAREIVVPVISASNPNYAAIIQQGITAEQLKKSLEQPQQPVWGNLLGNNANQKMVVYRINDPVTEIILNSFLNESVMVQMPVLDGIDMLKQELAKKPEAIAFCRLSDLLSSGQQTFPEGLALLPFDFNKNGKLEQIEDIYTNPETFSRGVWIGKYPKALYQNFYALSTNEIYTPAQRVFLNWMISAGQEEVALAELSPLETSEIASKYSKINYDLPLAGISTTKAPVWPYLLALIVLVVMVLFYFEFALRRSKNRKMNLQHNLLQHKGVFQIESLSIPKGMLYDKHHTWSFMEKDGTVRIGIDDFIQKITGPVSRIQLKDEGSKVLKGEPFCTLMVDGKKITLNSPVTGIIRAFNPQLIDQATLLNQSPFSEGWVYLIEPGNWNREMTFLKLADNYREWLQLEFIRFKDFITRMAGKSQFDETSVVLQDGGEMPCNLLHNMSPEVWEEFQTQFLDQAK